VGLEGELCLAGPQVAQCYLNDPVRTRERFLKISGMGGSIWYRTGDLVRQDPDSKCFYYLGRLDDQVQICGFRVELQEVDAALRRAAGTDIALSVAWPLHGGRADAIYGFVSAAESHDATSILEDCAKTLPTYMIPKEIFLIAEIPRNSNGKLDRGALAKTLEARINARPKSP
jgi:acyl-coenzyme A synthetase/AMP-(fatty) acid ligase